MFYGGELYEFQKDIRIHKRTKNELISDEILKELGFTQDVLKRLRKQKTFLWWG